MARAIVPALKPGVGPLLFLGAATLWTWPAVRIVLAPVQILGRQRDALTTVSFIAAAPRVGLSRVDALGAWPTGNPWNHPDSWSLAGIAEALSIVDPVRLHALSALLGVLAMGFAAEWVARQLGAISPWSWLAAIGFAFCGLSSNALLEGYSYHLLNPWMPLAVWGTWKLGQADGKLVHAAIGIIGFGGALLTTAYVGLATAIVVGVLGLAAARAAPARVAALAAGCALVGAVYALDFNAHPVLGITTDATVQGSSASLVDLLPPSDRADFERSSQTSALSATILALAAAAPVVLRRKTGWAPVLAAGLVGLVLSLGPHLTLDHSPTTIPLPLSVLLALPGASLFRFPARLGWTWALCGSLVAALVATEIGKKRGRTALFLFATAGIDAFVGLGLPLRQRTMNATFPSAYLESAGPIVDLFPGELDPGFAELWFSRLACFAQISHQRQIPYDCIGTSSDPGHAVAAAWRSALLAGTAPPEPFPAAIAFHPDFFRPNDRATLYAALRTLDPDPMESRDGGDHVVLFRIPE